MPPGRLGPGTGASASGGESGCQGEKRVSGVCGVITCDYGKDGGGGLIMLERGGDG